MRTSTKGLPFQLAMALCNSAPRDASAFSAHPRSCSGSAGLMGQPRWSSPGHNRTHIGVCLLDTNRRAALARILLDGSATLDAAQAALGHGAAIMPADLRVFLALVLLPRFYIHTSRRHHTSLVRDPLTACCPADHATHVEARVEAATTAPHIELSSPLAPTRHHGAPSPGHRGRNH